MFVVNWDGIAIKLPEVPFDSGIFFNDSELSPFKFSEKFKAAPSHSQN